MQIDPPASVGDEPPAALSNLITQVTSDKLTQIELQKPASVAPRPIPTSIHRHLKGLLSIFLCCACNVLENDRLKKPSSEGTSAAGGKSCGNLKTLMNGNAKDSKKHSGYLLGPAAPGDESRKCLVLDLDETLVHSSFKKTADADFVVPVEIDNQVHSVYVLKRPGVDEFLRRMGELFEVVVFTASLAKYADPVLDLLDTHKIVKHRLFREACCNHKGSYVKDLSQLGRNLEHIIIIDNSPLSYLFHPKNAVPISSWFSDAHDTELLDLIPFLEELSRVDNVVTVLDSGKSEAT
ncbi:uncharacterized protein VTP21DRAFT_7919 [Calcarisporiella thermophila]|uniref:uncharacterized protein n=1 Tax=Calcarisporiella thermophila TaxID=911321 RepID=UPI0037435881